MFKVAITAPRYKFMGSHESVESVEKAVRPFYVGKTRYVETILNGIRYKRVMTVANGTIIEMWKA